MSLFESLRAAQNASPFTTPWVEHDEHGKRLVRDAGRYLATDPEWIRRHHPEMFHGDELWLDDEGVWRYRESEDRALIKAAGAFTAYEKIPT